MSGTGRKKTDGKKISVMQEKIARLRVANPKATTTELAEMAGYSCQQAASTALNRPHVRDRILELMDADPSLRLKALTKKLAEGLNAKETKFFAKDGHVIETQDVVDYSTREGYLDIALDLHGAKQKNQTNVQNNFFSAEAFDLFLRRRHANDQPS